MGERCVCQPSKLFVVLFMCSDNDDDAIGSDDDPRNAVLEEGASNQDWQAIIARIQEELSISNFGHKPMEVDLSLNAQ